MRKILTLALAVSLPVSMLAMCLRNSFQVCYDAGLKFNESSVQCKSGSLWMTGYSWSETTAGCGNPYAKREWCTGYENEPLVSSSTCGMPFKTVTTTAGANSQCVTTITDPAGILVGDCDTSYIHEDLPYDCDDSWQCEDDPPMWTSTTPDQPEVYAFVALPLRK